MRSTRLYVPLPLISGQCLDLEGDSAHYLRNVLRMKAGMALSLFNGDGQETAAELLEVSKQRVALRLGETQRRDVESPLRVHLGLAVSRAERMDWALQKAVELGVWAVTPLLSERCVVQLSGERAAQKTAHWQKILQHAAEQSGRCVLPQLAQPEPLAAWLQRQQGLRLILDPLAENALSRLQPTGGRVTLLSGPEGGFSDHERHAAVAAGFTPVRLGNRVLRTETAALVALAAVQALWGDLAAAEDTAAR